MTGNTSNHHRYGEVKTRLTIAAGSDFTPFRLSTGLAKRKGLQLALEPLNGPGIAGYVLEPELWG